jgi:hypothetical protein
VIEWLPPVNAEVAYVAVPPLFSVPVPSVVVPSMKVTVPPGVPALEVTVAVKVTEAPKVDGFSEEARDVVVGPGLTVWESAGEVLPLKFVEPA